MSFTNLVEGKTPENDQLRNLKFEKKHSLFNAEMANLNLSKDASIGDAGNAGNQPQNAKNNQENSPDKTTKQAAKKVVKSILKQRTSKSVSSKDLKASSSRTS